jgi:hypothetical protein
MCLLLKTLFWLIFNKVVPTLGTVQRKMLPTTEGNNGISVKITVLYLSQLGKLVIISFASSHRRPSVYCGIPP